MSGLEKARNEFELLLWIAKRYDRQLTEDKEFQEKIIFLLEKVCEGLDVKLEERPGLLTRIRERVK